MYMLLLWVYGCLEGHMRQDGNSGAEPPHGGAGCAVQCYALEGAYPQSLSLLEEKTMASQVTTAVSLLQR
jgi:hypothetical protein